MALGYCRCHSSPTDEETEGRTEAMGLAKAGTTCLVERSSPHGHRGYGAGQGRHHMLGGAQLPAWAVSAPELSVVPPRCLSLQKKSDGDADNSD